MKRILVKTSLLLAATAITGFTANQVVTPVFSHGSGSACFQPYQAYAYWNPTNPFSITVPAGETNCTFIVSSSSGSGDVLIGTITSGLVTKCGTLGATNAAITNNFAVTPNSKVVLVAYVENTPATTNQSLTLSLTFQP